MGYFLYNNPNKVRGGSTKRIHCFFVGATILMLCGAYACAFAPATHMYIGSQTFDVWQNYDSDFYNCLNGSGEYSEFYVTLTRKFYYIGLTLPDMFDEEVQAGIDTLLTRLHENREFFWLTIIPTGELRGPLYIQDETLQKVQTRIEFDGSPPNSNLDALRLMVEHAHDNNWESLDKALIYGAYMHVVHDLYAHMVFIPARFSYGYALEADSASSDPLLYYPELFYEFFTHTCIPASSADFIKDVYIGVSDIEQPVNMSAPAEFLYRVNILGQYYEGWQEPEYIEPVQKFIEAANAPGVGYGTSSLTFERLKAYMHGWGILLFLSYGYTSNTYDDIGGVFLHPSWDFGDIKDFWVDIMDANSMTVIPFQIVNHIAYFFKKGVVRSHIGEIKLPATFYLPAELDQLDDYPDSWPSFFETVSGIDKFWSCVPEDDRTEEVWHNYYKLRRIIQVYDNHSLIKKPNLRNTYMGELPNIVSLKNRYRGVVDESEPLDYNMSGISIHTLSRKAGLVGGMYSVYLARDYYEQPGVIDICFQTDEDFVYTETEVSLEGDPYHMFIDLSYDLVTIGPTDVQIWGNNSITLASTDPPLPGLSRENSILTVNAREALNQGIDELSFRVYTQAIEDPTRYWLMLNSDYREAFDSDLMIRDMELYQYCFNYDPSTGEADPTRDYNENPHSDPKKYWPYVLPLTAAPYLNAPIISYSDAVSGNKININWNDNSSYETEYIIEKKIGDEGTWSVIGSTNEPDIEEWEDNSVIYGDKYWYRVRAYNEGYDIYSDYSDSVYDYAIPNWSDNEDALIYNNGRKIAVDQDGTICIVYSHDRRIWYSESTDGGETWSKSVCLGEPPFGTCCFPAIVCDEVGRRMVVWEVRDENIAEGSHRISEIYYCCIDPQTGDTIKSIEPITSNKEYPTVITDNGDVCIAFVSSDRNVGGHIRPGRYCCYLSFPYNQPPQSAEPQVVEYANMGCQNPNLVKTQNGNLYIVYERSTFSGGKYTHNYLVSEEYDGNNWVNMKQIGESQESHNALHYYPSAASEGDDIHVSWLKDEHHKIYYAHFNGTSWSSPQLIASSGVGLTSIMNNSIHTVLTWEKNNEIYCKIKEGDEWSETMNLSSSPDKDSKSPHIMSLDELDKFVLIWNEGNDEPYEIKMKAIDLCPPLPPQNLSGIWEHFGKNWAEITLQWSPNSEPDLGGYYIYIGESGSGPFERVGTAEPGETPSFVDRVYAWSSHWYYITAFDLPDNESEPSDTIKVDPEYYPACPFLYVWDGTQFIEDNNLLAGSYQGEVVTDPYGLTQPLLETGPPRRYKLEIREEETEHSFFDMVTLKTIDHPEDVEVGVSVSDEIVPITTSHIPLSAFSGSEDYADVLSNDTSWFEGCTGDTLVIEFGLIDGVEDKELWFNADKSGYPISIEIYRGDSWEYVTSVFPRENFSTIPILPLTELIDDGETLTLKLVWYAEHNLKTIMIIQPEDMFILERTAPLIFAIHSRLGNVRQKLLYEDEDYAEVLAGDTLRLVFAHPVKIPRWTRSFVFVSNGYYITESGGGGAQTLEEDIPFVHSLSVYPNPAKNEMNIKFGLPIGERVSLDLYDISGRMVRTIVDDNFKKGYHMIQMDCRNLPTGVYFARLVTDSFVKTKKLLLVR